MTNLDERAERLGGEDFAHYERVCVRTLERLGVDIESKVARTTAVMLFEFKNTEDRFTAWLAESLLSGFEYAFGGEWLVAFRCSLQVREYLGRCGGRWPSPSLHDAYIALQNLVEDRLRKSVR